MASKSKSDIVYFGLKQSIIDCSLTPSSKIKINDVCERFDVSLGAAREALSRLAAEGMVTMEAQKGFSVASISWGDFKQIMDARVEIETYCLKHSIQNGDMDWEVQVAASHHRLARLSAKRDPSHLFPNPAWIDAHAEFHRALVAACPNKCMLELREMLYARSERYRHWAVVLSLSVGQRNDVQEHEELARLSLDRDDPGACAAMRPHFSKTTDILLEAARNYYEEGRKDDPEYSWLAASG